MLTEHQEEIKELILKSLLSKQHCTLSGYAGTGKSYVTSMIVRDLEALKKSYIILAPTHKALSVLKSKEDKLNSELDNPFDICKSKFETVASFLKIRPNYAKVGMDLESPDFIFATEPLNSSKKSKQYQFVIIDECSMISESIYKQLMTKHGITYLFVGDIAQLPPIKEKESLTFKIKNIFYLNEIIRTKNQDIVDLCNLCRSDDFKQIKNVKSSENVIVMSKKNYQYNCEKVLAFTNKSVFNHNTSAKKKLNPSKTIISVNDVVMFYQDVFTSQNPRPRWFPGYKETNFYPDEKIVSNCEEFIVTSIIEEDAIFKITLTDDLLSDKNLEFIMLKPNAYNEFVRKYLKYKSNWDLHKLFIMKYGCILPEPISMNYKDEFDDIQKIELKKTFDLAYSLTVHKSQGSTYDSVAVDVDDILFSKTDANTLLYTAVSRAKEKVILLL